MLRIADNPKCWRKLKPEPAEIMPSAGWTFDHDIQRWVWTGPT
jgi:hypothetical protein